MVDYRAEEALAATLAQACSPSDADTGFWQERIRYLLDYEDAFNDAHELFCRGRNQSPLLQAIAHLRILDPAVGSGAFLMAVLYKLPLALRRLDPYN